MRNLNNKPEIIFCDYSNSLHIDALIKLLGEYMNDPMGEASPYSEKQKMNLVEGLKNHHSSFVLLAKLDNQFVGMATCFINFSTFRCAPYINIHDLTVLPSFRGNGIGRLIMNKIFEIGSERECCKVNLEVREDNPVAMHLYSDMGFKECNPPMKFWEFILKK